MILPIYAYGHPVLKKVAAPIEADYPELATLLANMWETMYNADGVGIAAPQVGLSIRLFVADTTQVDRKGNDKPGDEPFKRVFKPFKRWSKPFKRIVKPFKCMETLPTIFFFITMMLNNKI